SDSELGGDLAHRLSDLVLLEPEKVILPLEVFVFLLELAPFLLRGAGPLSRLVVARHQLRQEGKDLTRLFDPLRDPCSRFSSGCGGHDQPRLLPGALRLRRRGRRGDGCLPAVTTPTCRVSA